MRLETITSLAMTVTSLATLEELTRTKVDTLQYNELSEEVAMIRVRPVALLTDILIKRMYDSIQAQSTRHMLQQELHAIIRQVLSYIQRLIDAPSALDEWVLMRAKQ